MENKDNEEKKILEEIGEEEDIENVHLERLTDSQITETYIFRICILGDQNVGKTSLIKRFVEGSYSGNYSATIGVDFKVITLKYKDIVSKVHIWDTAGQERFKSVAVNYFRSAHGFLFVYDITDEDSFVNIENWIELAFNNSTSHLINFLVGNKSDLEEERKVQKKDAEDFAKQKELIFLEASAKNNYNVGKVFEYFTYKLIRYFKIKKIKQKENEKCQISGNAKQIPSNSQTENNKDKCAC